MLNENRARFTTTVRVNSSGTGMCINVVKVKVSTVMTRMVSVSWFMWVRLKWLKVWVQNGAM